MPSILFSMLCASGAIILGGLLVVAPMAGLYSLLIVPLIAYGLHLRFVARGQPGATQGDPR